MFGLGPVELLIIAGLILLVFGPGQIPKFARGIGQALREVREAKRELKAEVEDVTKIKDEIKRELGVPPAPPTKGIK